jgi:hypothetical protein
MRVQCRECQRLYDDAQRWTICPHNRLEASPEGDGRGEHGLGYCEEHDLFNCPNHGPKAAPANEVKRASRALQEALGGTVTQTETTTTLTISLPREKFTEHWHAAVASALAAAETGRI